MAGYNKRTTYTSTGAKDSVGDFDASDVSFAVSDDGSNSSTSTVQAQIGEGWYAVDFTIGEPQTLEGPVNGLRINITNLGTATNVYLDITARGRYG